MAIDERLGREIALYWNDNKVGNVKTADLTVEGNTVEINNDSTGDWTRKILARKNWNLSLTVDTNEHTSGSVQSTIAEDFFTSTATGSLKLAAEPTGSGDVTYTGDAIVNNFSIAKSTDDILESSFEFEGDGELVRSVIA